MSGDPNQDYFVDGLVDEIITALGRLRWLFVIARNSSFAFKGQAVDVKQIGRQLGVHYVLEGSVRRAGDRVRITSQLIETASGASMWGERLEGAIDDIFELQDQVASLVAGAIEPELQFAEISRTREKSAQILTAYDLYLRALAEAVKWDLGDCARPLPLLRRALAVDPSYAPAAGMLAGMRARQLAYGVQLKPEEIAEALKLARFVMQTGTEDAEALAWSGYALASLAGDKAGALHAINRALMLNPNNAFGWWACALVHYYEFRPDAAVRAIEQAIRLSPLDPYAHGFKAIYACALMLAGRHDEAVCWIDQSLHEQPYHPFYVRVKVALSGHLDHSEQAKEWITRLLGIIPDTTIAWFEAYAAKFLSPETLGVWLEGLRRAGLPEA
jgi:adenylate cyclase